MPGYLGQPAPVGVFPFSLSTKFTASRTYEARVSEYHDGTTDRGLMVDSSRKSWRMSKRLSAADAQTLRAWWDAHQADAFYFYDFRETVPLFSYDETGVATAGRYIVRFNSDWSQSIDMVRSNVDVELVEIAGPTDAPPAIIPGPDNGTLTTDAVLFVVSEHDVTHGSGLSDPEIYQLANAKWSTDGGGTWTGLFNPGSWGTGGDAWAKRTDSTSLGSLYASGGIAQFAFNTISASIANAINQLLIYEVYIEFQGSDGSILTVRPISATVQGGVGNAGNRVDDPTFALDGDDTIAAVIYSDETGVTYPQTGTVPSLFVKFA